MADGADPAQYQAPGLLEADGHDLPVSPDRPAMHASLQAVLESAPLGPGHALLQERRKHSDRLCPIYAGSYAPRDMLFGAALMALFNTMPFLNFLEEAAINKAFDDHVILGLVCLARSFRGWNQEERREQDQQAAVVSRAEITWQLVAVWRDGQPEPFNFGPRRLADFVRYLFERLENAGLQQGRVGGDDVDLSVRFKQLFKYFPVRHTPMRCRCDQPVLRRQATRDARPTGYCMVVEVARTMNLDQAISAFMREKLEIPRTCPECGDKGKPACDFDKLAYLPEVLFIFPDYTDRPGGPDDHISPAGAAELTCPEWLDMSALRDDPARPGDQTDCTYKIQSVVTADRAQPGPRTRYKAALRAGDDEFAQFEHAGTSETLPDYITFESVTEASNGVPHMLVYVRERRAGAGAGAGTGAAGKGNPAGTHAVGPRPANPRAGTAAAGRPATTYSTATGHAGGHGPEDRYGVQRFIDAQDAEVAAVKPFESARSELTRGRKSRHWMWFVFPVVAGLSHSTNGRRYSISSLGEARAYWDHPLLRDRYLELLEIVRYGPEPDLEVLFGGPVDAQKFLASMTLFMLIRLDDHEQRDAFQDVFLRFDRDLHGETAFAVVRWLGEAGEDAAQGEVLALIADDEQQAGPDYSAPSTRNDSTGMGAAKSATTRQPGPGGSSTSSSGGHGDGHGTDTSHESAQRIGSELLRLAERELDVDDTQFEPQDVLLMNNAARRLGRVVLGFGVPQGAATPVDAPGAEERARRLGRHLMALSLPADPSDADYDYPPGSSPAASGVDSDDGGGLGLDGASDDIEPGDGVDPDDDDDEDPFQAVAIPTDPDDPRIEECESWTLAQLKREFQKEQLDGRGLGADPEKHRKKFRKHFELERDYSIYHEGRLRQAIQDRGIPVRHGVARANKAELVDTLTNYDAQRLRDLQYVDGDEMEETDSVQSESAPDQSSDASGTEDWYVDSNRLASSAGRKGEATPVQPRRVAATARPLKRPRYEEEEEEEEQDEEEDEDEEDGEEMEPYPRPMGPVRIRPRY